MSRALVIVASNRAAAGTYADRSGALLVAGLAELGLDADGPTVVPDGRPVEEALRAAIGAGYDLILTTGGTGLAPTDRTPEATRPLLDVEVPGLAELVRAHGVAGGIPTAALSRGLAGIAGRTLVVNLPGSAGGARDGLEVLRPVLSHALDQIAGIDHQPPPEIVTDAEGSP